MRPHPVQVLVGAAAAAFLAVPAPAQEVASRPAIIDTVIITRDNVFNEEEAASSGIFRIMNKLHIVTKEYVIRDYLQFERGEPYDSAAIAESERQLRLKRIFRELSMDSTTLEDGRLAIVVRSQDGWSTKPKFKFSIASTGDWTGTFGINEINLLGTGNQVYAAYVKELDRDGLNASADFDRTFRSNIDVAGNYAGLSDGKNGNWIVGLPFRNTESSGSYEWDGLWADQDILQYRVEDVADTTVLDTTVYRRDAFVNNLNAGLATTARTGNYLRFGATVGIRNEQYFLDPDAAGMVEDSIYGTLGLWGEISKVRYRQYQRFNGFGTEDIDLSSTVRVTATLAPESFGWAGTGVGLGLQASTGQSGVVGGRGWVWTSIEANYLWNAAVQDSGRVIFNVAGGFKPAERHSTAIQMQFGRLWNPAPGNEFDLGFENAPRGWEAHSFVGTRTWWAQIEHRFYAVDKFLNLVGIGFGAFFDYGGAWYDDQSARSGGSVGAGLRLGSALSTVAMTGRADLVYRIGKDVSGDRWVFAFGSGFAFPRRTIPVINYRAQPPP
jgi:outer membrane protein assembly factor BamA